MFIRFDMIHERDGRTVGHRMTAKAALDTRASRGKKSFAASDSLVQFGFCRAILKRGLCRHAVSVRPSVCLSRSYIPSKRITMSSKFIHYRVAKPF